MGGLISGDQYLPSTTPPQQQLPAEATEGLAPDIEATEFGRTNSAPAAILGSSEDDAQPGSSEVCRELGYVEAGLSRGF